MLNRQFFIFFILLNFLSCNKADIDCSYPDCLEIKIKEFKRNRFCKNGQIKKYIFQNEEIFVFDGESCEGINDGGSSVYNSNCEDIGFLGGIAGNTEINGEEFENAVFKCIVWEE